MKGMIDIKSLSHYLGITRENLYYKMKRYSPELYENRKKIKGRVYLDFRTVINELYKFDFYDK